MNNVNKMDGQQMNDANRAHLSGFDANVDDLFDALSSERRRHVLSYLRDADDDVAELAELVDWVVTREADRDGDQREAVAISLHHVHVPKLANCGFVEYDARSNTVRYRGHPELERIAAFADETGSDRP